MAREMKRRKETGAGAKYYAEWKARDPEGYRRRYIKANQRRYARPSGKLDVLIRNALYRSLSGRRKQKPAYEALGYSLADLMRHLERQFLPGMSWENYGAWHVDHILPISSFEIDSTECVGFKTAWALANLRPLWAKENMRKSSVRTHLL